MIHHFANLGSHIDLPSLFTYPFRYTPHPLCLQASTEVMNYLSQQEEWHEELSCGKMFGVLLVRTDVGEVGYLAAFSGNLAGSNRHEFFVPPIYDLLDDAGFFKQEEAVISAINNEIETLEQNREYRLLKVKEEREKRFVEEENEKWKKKLAAAKAQRDLKRQDCGQLSAEEERMLVNESQFLKAEFKRKQKAWKEKLEMYRQGAKVWEQLIADKRKERKERSATLQNRLFEAFRVLNARSEEADLLSIFRNTPQGYPPAGAGECALPKLLQYAYSNQMRPLAMAEFWWGASPQNEVRHHGAFYPSCKGKCEPILKHMLQGLKVEPDPLPEASIAPSIDTVFEDAWLWIVNKPAGMLSVPGKTVGTPSVYDLARKRLPHADGPLLVHRLDMDTSGLVLIAKTKEVHKYLQQLFESRQIRKRYIALLQGNPDGLPVGAEGIINLPLSPNWNNRPCQQVDHLHGKEAKTHYFVLSHTAQGIRIKLSPFTGRTHQLRIHMAHSEGLNHPIVGDTLYGSAAHRLYLHAQELEFIHPMTGENLCVQVDPDF